MEPCERAQMKSRNSCEVITAPDKSNVAAWFLVLRAMSSHQESWITLNGSLENLPCSGQKCSGRKKKQHRFSGITNGTRLHESIDSTSGSFLRSPYLTIGWLQNLESVIHICRLQDHFLPPTFQTKISTPITASKSILKSCMIFHVLKVIHPCGVPY